MLTVVTGPPCAGKSTYIAERAQPGDLVIDFDQLARDRGYPHDHVEWGDQHPAIDRARQARRTFVKLATQRGYPGTAWLVDAAPHPTSLRIYRRVNACVVTLDPGRNECARRALAAERSASTLAEIDRWYGVPGA